jgi:tRNA threonylcarbamoyladenosine modification (KEOPS) complex  Pcc1 subunit
MKLKLELSLVCTSPETARGLQQVLEPDNVGVPEGQRFSMRRKGSLLLFVVESKDLMSALSSMEGLLSDISLFRDVSMLAE